MIPLFSSSSSFCFWFVLVLVTVLVCEHNTLYFLVFVEWEGDGDF